MNAKCGKCDSTYFGVQETTVSGSSKTVQLISCSKCGTSIGVANPTDINNQLQEILSQLNYILQRMDQTTYNQEYNFTSKINALGTELSNIRYQLSNR